MPGKSVQFPGRSGHLPGKSVQFPGGSGQMPGTSGQFPGSSVQLGRVPGLKKMWGIIIKQLRELIVLSARCII
jgi:hypothetical protein